uniref:Uncharacterized protein n=1 Tax=Astyanax mexicanus TaxID=7994 RepID=A0A8B9GYA5_ASTMX
MVFTWENTTYLHQLDHVRMVQLLEDGDFLVYSLQRAFGLRWALWASLSQQSFLGQDFHENKSRNLVSVRFDICTILHV